MKILIETLSHIHDNIEEWALFYAELVAQGDPVLCNSIYEYVMMIVGQ